MTNDTEKMLAALEKQVAELRELMIQTKREPSVEVAKRCILASLKKHGGHQTVEQICAECHLTKGTAWRRIDELEREAKVWLRVTHSESGRKHTVVYHADHVAA
jgi:hypothetical protein